MTATTEGTSSGRFRGKAGKTKPRDYDPMRAVLSKLVNVRKDNVNEGAHYADCPACGDKKGRLHVRRGDKGQVLFHCPNEGCGYQDIARAIGLTPSDLYPPDDPPARPHKTRQGDDKPKGGSNGVGVAKLVQDFARGLTGERLAELAGILGVPAAALQQIELLGYSDKPQHKGYRGGCWVFPERSAAGEIVGATCRYRDGDLPAGADNCPGPNKMSLPGGHRGLFLPAGWREVPGPVLCVEGASDVAALVAMGLSVVGRPSNTGGAAALASAVGLLPADKPVVIVGENDWKRDGSCPGLDGAKQTAAKVAEAIGRPVAWALPPDRAKDVRAWVQAHVDFAHPNDAREAGEALAADLVRHATGVKPGGAGDGEEASEWDGPADEAFGEFPAPVLIDDLVDDEEDDWLVDGVIKPGAITLFNATWKVGKTTLLCPMFGALKDGSEFLGMATRAARVLLVTEEASTRAWVRRRDAHGLGGVVHLLMRPMPRPSKVEKWARFLRYAKAEAVRLGCGVLAIDTLSAFWPVRDENSAPEVQTAISGIQHILLPAGLAVLIVHHDRKAGGDPGMGSRGSGALPAAVDIILELKRETQDLDDPRRRLLGLGRYEESARDMLIQWTGDGYEVVAATRGEARDLREADEARETARALPAFGSPGVAVEEVAKALGTSDKTAHTRLRKALARNFARRDPKGGRGGGYLYSQSEGFTRTCGGKADESVF